MGRLTQSLVEDSEARLQMYIDDPVAAIMAEEVRARRIAALFITAWLVMGFELAMRKAQFGQEIDWVGYAIKVTNKSVTASIKPSFLDNLMGMTKELMKKNFIKLKDLRSYTGRATHVSNLLFAWRPFLDPLWAAVSSRKPRGEDGQGEQKRSKAIKGTVWTKQVRSSLSWVSAFLRGGIGKLTRTWHVDFFDEETNVHFVLDASPYGLGGVAYVNGVPEAFFHSDLTEHDERIHKYKIGDSRGQQCWECLTVLVATRAFAPIWLQ